MFAITVAAIESGADRAIGVFASNSSLFDELSYRNQLYSSIIISRDKTELERDARVKTVQKGDRNDVFVYLLRFLHRPGSRNDWSKVRPRYRECLARAISRRVFS